jgi:hypothetical protein
MAGGFPLSALNAPQDKETSVALRAKATRFLVIANFVVIDFIGLLLGVFWGCGLIRDDDYDQPYFIVAMVTVGLTVLAVPVANTNMVLKYRNNPALHLEAEQNFHKVSANKADLVAKGGECSTGVYSVQKGGGKPGPEEQPPPQQQEEEHKEERNEETQEAEHRTTPPRPKGNRVAPAPIVTYSSSERRLSESIVMRPSEESPAE